jgi:adenylyltransferase/sulfurtransferase
LCALLLALTACSQSQPASQPPASSAPSAAEAPQSGPIQPRELAAQLQQPDRPFLLDVREPFEAEIATIPGTSELIPLGELSGRVDEINADAEIVVYCRSGNRSSQAVHMLRAAGFTNVRNLQGGINAWAETVDPSMTQY